MTSQKPTSQASALAEPTEDLQLASNHNGPRSRAHAYKKRLNGLYTTTGVVCQIMEVALETLHIEQDKAHKPPTMAQRKSLQDFKEATRRIHNASLKFKSDNFSPIPHAIPHEAEPRIGSRIDGGCLYERLPCANEDMAGGPCLEPGNFPCSCRLVSYCSIACKGAHYDNHKEACIRAMVPLVLQLNKGQKQDLPSWTSVGGQTGPCQGQPCLAAPAFSLFEQPAKEQLFTHKDCQLCFISGGDLRNVIQTVTSLPEGYKGCLTLHINDINTRTALRNLLVLVLLGKHGGKAIDLAIQLLYSSAITEGQHEEVKKAMSSVLAWKACSPARPFLPLSKSKLTPRFSNEAWAVFQSLSQDSAPREAACSSTGHSGKLTEDKHNTGQRFQQLVSPSTQESWRRFKNTLLLIPYGAYAGNHVVPNAFSLGSDGQENHLDCPDPLSLWPVEDVLKTRTERQLPQDDLYGALYFHVGDRLRKFVEIMDSVCINLEFYNFEPRQLACELSSRNVMLDRIDLADICEHEGLNVRRVLHDWKPLLRKMPEGKAASLIAAFTMWFKRNPTSPSDQIFPDIIKAMQRAARKFPGDSNWTTYYQWIVATGDCSLVCFQPNQPLLLEAGFVEVNEHYNFLLG